MKKKLYLIILILLSSMKNLNSSSQNNIAIVIIPFFNISNIKEFDYISEEISNSLNEKIKIYDYFNIYDWENAENIFYNNNFNYKRLFFEKDQEQIKELLGVDLNIVGFYNITPTYIRIYFKCFEKKEKVTTITLEYLNDYNINKIKEYIDYSSSIMTKMIVDKYKKNINISKNKTIDLTSLNKNKKTLQARNITGYTLLGSGVLLSISGIIILPVGINNYYKKSVDSFNELLNKKDENSKIFYETLNLNYLFIFISSIGTINTGLLLSLIGFPLFLYAKKEMNLKNKVGLAIYTTGIFLFEIGIFFMIFNIAYYYPYYQNALKAYEAKLITSENNELIYNFYISFISLSITSTSIGLIMAIISIPFFLYKEKNSKKNNFYFNVDYNKNLTLSFCYNF